jgi:predicted membrane channel-forming protein YqfA (hemolysin III family)
MDRILKIIDYIIYVLIIGSIIGFFYGTYQTIDLLFIRG